MVILRRFVAFFCLLSLCLAQHTPRKVADFPIRTTDGKSIHLGQYHGKVVMVVMFLTTCDECLQTLQFMARLQSEMGPRGLQIVAISLDPSAALVVPFAERYRFPFPMAHLEKDQVILLADLSKTAHPTVPYIMFVGWQGTVRFQYAGNDPIYNSGEKGIRGVADGLLHEAAEKKEPTYKKMPAPSK